MRNYLVIDDNPEILNVFFEIGTGNRTKVFLASNLVEASELLETIKFDVIVCDYLLHGSETGILYARKAKALQPKAMFILMSGMFKEEINEVCNDQDREKIDTFMEKTSALTTVWDIGWENNCDEVCRSTGKKSKVC